MAEDDGSLGLQSVVENESEGATSDSAGQHIDGGNEGSGWCALIGMGHCPHDIVVQIVSCVT